MVEVVLCEETVCKPVSMVTGASECFPRFLIFDRGYVAELLKQ
jgi:hypothetical protein